MAKLYFTKDIKELIDKKIESDSAQMIVDPDMSEEDMLRFSRELRVFKKYAYELIEEMTENDQKYDAEIARWKAEKEAREAGEAGDK